MTVSEEISNTAIHVRSNEHSCARFLFTFRDDVPDEFDHTLEMDVVHLVEGNVLYIFCSDTGLQNYSLLNWMSAEQACKAIKSGWIKVYAGAPDYIICDSGSILLREEMQQLARSIAIIVKIALLKPITDSVILKEVTESFQPFATS